MNTDNYFARFLCKKINLSDGRGSSEAARATPVVGPHHSTAADNCDSLKEEQPVSTNGEDRLVAPSAEVVLTGETLRFCKRFRAESPPKDASSVVVPSQEEDELDLLLGKEKAREVKHGDALQVNPPADQALLSDVRALSNGAVTAARHIGSLSWSTCSSRVVAQYADYFNKQFAYELHRSRALFSSFSPFFKDKVLHRIQSGHSGGRPVFFDDSVSAAANPPGALPGFTLRDYQVSGVQFLLTHFHRGMSCILADDMGLGKTAQIASFLSVLKSLHAIEGPHLIVAPLSTLTSWTRELARWAPHLRAVKYHGERQARRHTRYSHHNRHAVLVTTPALLSQDRGFFRKRSWVVLIVDEAHVLKSHDTHITTTARKLTACFRIAVTGTPVHNDVREVWSLMGFLYPSFTAGYDSGVTRREKDAVQAAQDCSQLLQYIMLRRTKEFMELGIPPRVDEPVAMLEPSYIQSQLLAHLVTQALEEEEEEEKGGADAGGGRRHLQAHLSHQRAVCNHPMSLLLLASEGRSAGAALWIEECLRRAGVPMSEHALVRPSAKMVYLDGLLRRLRAEGSRCLIFSNFTTTLDLLEAFCMLRGYSYERLDGSCNRVERELSMLRFNALNASCFLFLVTTTAGGVGVTLTGANVVILFDSHFNPQLDRQAADRAHRIGQTRTVHVHRLCLAGTVEEHICEIAQRKASLGDFIVDGGRRRGHENTAQLSAQEIHDMLRQLNGRQRRRWEGGSTATMKSAALDTGDDDDPATVEKLLRVVAEGLHHDAASERGGPAGGGLGRFGSRAVTTHQCFVCGGIMRPLEPLYHCIVCPKAYHAGCLGLRKPTPGEAAPRQWSCPRHACAQCGKAQREDGAIFMCVSCPRSCCFDCLDPCYFVLDEAGLQLLHVKRTYTGMEEEGVDVRRSCYYISCLRCCGVVSSSSGSTSSSATPLPSNNDDDDDDEKSGELLLDS